MNKPTSPRLVREACSILVIARALAVIGLFVAFLAALPLPFFSTSVDIPFDARAVNVTTDFPKLSGDVSLGSLSGRILFRTNAAATDEMVALRRWSIVPSLFVTCLFSFAVAHLLLRVCRNIREGQLFTGGNFQLLRRVGYAIMGCAVVEAAARCWSEAHVAAYLAQHVTFGQLKVGNDPIHYLSHFDLRFFVAGVLVLVVAHILQQGTVLKQEADLTV